MKTIGIVAEFNPFHSGHHHLLAEARRLSGADFAIVVMSGNFVQRGAPAILDKYVRTQMALMNGADLVVELPLCYATASAEYFARGAVCLLERLGVVDELWFGSEGGEIAALAATAALLDNEGAVYRSVLRDELKNGASFALARGRAIDSSSQSSHGDPAAIMAQPNNILAVEYIRALSFFASTIKPMTIKREGSGHHGSVAQTGEFPSATALRGLLHAASDPAPFVPQGILPLYGTATHYLHEDDFSALLRYKLLMEAGSGYTDFFDVSADISAKISKTLAHSAAYGYSDFIHALKSRDLTYLRLSRCLCHILLDIREDDIAAYREGGYVFYARMLGFGEGADGLLRAIKRQSAIPLLSKLADADRLLDTKGRKMLAQDVRAAHIYESVRCQKYGGEVRNEYRQGIVKNL